jgi:hypothetical protein
MFVLKGYCIPILGYQRGIIYNLLKGTYYFVPKDVVQKLNTYNDVSLEKFSPTIINFLKSIELIFDDNINIASNLDIIYKIKDATATSIIANIPHSVYLGLKNEKVLNCFDFVKSYLCLKDTMSSFNSSIFSYKNKEYWIMKKNKIFFNLDFFAESLQYHSFYNRMIIINKDKKITNSLYGEYQSMSCSINNDILLNSNITETWTAKKESCDICCDCEYRYMCIDARFPHKRNDGSWYFLNECNYNPYICKWKNEIGFYSLKECGITSDKKGFDIDTDKLQKILKN